MRKLLLLVIFSVIGISSNYAYSQQGEVDFNNFRCLDFVNGQGENSTNRPKADLAKIWLIGYLSGYYNGKEKLQLVEDDTVEQKAISAVLGKCRENPEVTLLTVAEFVASSRTRDLPKVLSNEFDPKGYLCGAHVQALSGSASQKLKAEMADLWAFAFVQGHVNISDSELLIPVENKPAITGAIASNCAKNPEISYFDLTAAVAPMVTPQ